MLMWPKGRSAGEMLRHFLIIATTLQYFEAFFHNRLIVFHHNSSLFDKILDAMGNIEIGFVGNFSAGEQC